MNCYAGLAKRIVKSFFPREIPVPQLQPLDARKIFYASSDEEVWKATLVWAEAKAQEREATALRAVSETNTDESYDSDDSEVGVPIQPISRLTSLFADDSDDEVFEGPVRRTNIATWESGVRTELSWAPWVEAERLERERRLVAKKRWHTALGDVMIVVEWYKEIVAVMAVAPEERTPLMKARCSSYVAAVARVAAGKAAAITEKRAATIIQAAARGRAVRAWNAFVSANKKPSNKPYDAHLASLLAAPVAPPRKPPAALKGKLGNLIFSIPSQPSATKKPSLFGDDDDDDESGCPYPDSDEDEGDGDYGTDDDDFGDWLPPASKLSKTGCPALGDGHHRLFLCN